MARRDAPFPQLSAKEALILSLMRSGEMYGLELVGASDGALKRGTVYVTLGRMEGKGFITSRVEDSTPPGGGLPRRLYKATPLGRQLLSVSLSMRKRFVPGFAR